MKTAFKLCLHIEILLQSMSTFKPTGLQDVSQVNGP